jgi:hypothetical protein
VQVEKDVHPFRLFKAVYTKDAKTPKLKLANLSFNKGWKVPIYSSITFNVRRWNGRRFDVADFLAWKLFI